MSNRTLNTPQELADFLTGKELYNDGFNMSSCKSAAQQQGWQSAQQRDIAHYKALVNDLGCSVCDGFAMVYERKGTNIYLDRWGDWMTVEVNGKTIIDTRQPVFLSQSA